MKKLILGLSTLVALNVMATPTAATGSSLAPVSPFTGTANKIDNTIKIGGDANSINRLSVIYGNRTGTGAANYYSPTGEKVIHQDIYTDTPVANLRRVKVVTTNYEADNTDFNHLNQLVPDSEIKDLSAPNASTSYTVNYNGSFDSNSPYFQYVLDMDTNTVHKTYFADGTRASYRVIKTADIEDYTPEELRSPNYKPSGGYIKDTDVPQIAQKGEIKPSTTLDPNDPNFYTDNANYPVSGNTVYNYLNKWQDQNGIGALNRRVDDLEKGVDEAKAGVALGAAMANIPDNFREGDLNQLGVGVGYYAGHSAVALGYSRRMSDNKFVLKTSVGFNTAGAFSAGVGAGYSF